MISLKNRNQRNEPPTLSSMDPASVRITDYFEARLLEFERRWIESGNAEAFDLLIQRLDKEVLPRLRGAPRAARNVSGQIPEQFEATLCVGYLVDMLERARVAGGELYVHEFGDAPSGQYALLYLLANEMLYLVSIRETGSADITTRSSSVPHSAQSDRSPGSPGCPA
jgi:hypothetical protein